jgi:hypothetical protein
MEFSLRSPRPSLARRPRVYAAIELFRKAISNIVTMQLFQTFGDVALAMRAG